MTEPLGKAPRQYRRLTLALLITFLAPIAPIDHAAANAAQRVERASYVFLARASENIVMSGSTEDIRRARRLRTGQEGLLYVRIGDAAYIVRDPATLRQVESILEPQSAIGSQQAGLGARQAELGSRQAALGQRQSRLGAEQARAARLALGGPSRAEAFGRQQEAIGRQQDELGRQQDELGRQQDALGRQQDELSRQQDALGRQQDRAGREADVRLRALVTDAAQRGVAQRVN